MRERRCSKYAIHPARRSRINEVSVIQNPVKTHVLITPREKRGGVPVPGAATKCICTPSSLLNLRCTMTYRAMSNTKAMRVRRAAVKDRSDAIRVKVRCEEKENRRAIKVTAAAKDM